ncbi:MAG: hypothetical protein NC453_25985, partial [Muribaculum sp.]|nr:hypothetical protein [Muribaculum sp.]
QAMDSYKAEKELMMQPVEQERKNVHNAFSIEFDKASQMNEALDRLLSSHYDVQSAYAGMLPEGKAQQLDSIVCASFFKLDKRLNQAKDTGNTAKTAIESLKDNK